MVLSKKDFIKMLIGASDALDDKIDEFSDIDSKFGDGDHGWQNQQSHPRKSGEFTRTRNLVEDV